MNLDALARVLHVLGVILWIGGVAMVTTVVLPSVRAMADPERRAATFEEIEGRFGRQAKIWTQLVAATGFFMLYRRNAWALFLEPSFWWLHMMVLVWLLFTLVLFVFEPWFLHRWFQEEGRKRPEATYRAIHWLHVMLLAISLLAAAGAVAGSHGWFIAV